MENRSAGKAIEEERGVAHVLRCCCPYCQWCLCQTLQRSRTIKKKTKGKKRKEKETKGKKR